MYVCLCIYIIQVTKTHLYTIHDIYYPVIHQRTPGATAGFGAARPGAAAALLPGRGPQPRRRAERDGLRRRGPEGTRLVKWGFLVGGLVAIF